MMFALTTGIAVVLTSIATLPSATALTSLKTHWEAYTSALPMPAVIDMTQGGHLDMDIGQASHDWTEDGSISGQVYGYAIMNQTPTFPGPSIVVAKNVPISITWHNKLTAPHLLAQSVEQSIFVNESLCYPNCGVPAVTHLHGGEVPAKYDGLPFKTIYKDESREFEYQNRQLESTAVYHDHADGLNRLNTWAGLMGAYIIQDAEKEANLNLNIATDIPLVINDRLIDTSGNLLYSDDNCNAGATVWVPEAFGNVNLVNGRIMPYVEVPPAQVRFRVVNAANSRHYEFSVPFPNLCKVVATDSGLVETPQLLGDTLVIFPLERVELVCDFSGVADGTAFELIDTQSSSQSTPYDPRVLQIRVAASLLTDAMTVREIPATLNKFKSLKALYEAGGQERNVTLGEMTDAMSCPTMTTIHYKEKPSNMSAIANALQCVKGTVEKWNFINPTADPHPFHWHLVHVQCGDTEATIKTNELKDVAVIPSAGDRAADTVTQVCYIACTPGDYLIENATREAEEFGFDTTEPYVAHCHVLEHEENMMMSWFRIIEEYRSGGSSGNTTSSSVDSASSSVGSGSHSSGDGSNSPTVGSGSSSEIDSGVGSGSYSQAGQSSYPAKDVTYAQYHHFGTEEYAKYHRCDGHFNRQGMYTTSNASSDGANAYDSTSSERSGKGHVMTAISSTVVGKEKQTRYDDAEASTGDGSVNQGGQGYLRTDSSGEMSTSDNDASDAGQGYGAAASKIGSTTTTTNVTGNEGVSTTSRYSDDTYTSGNRSRLLDKRRCRHDHQCRWRDRKQQGCCCGRRQY
jgi:FtsP/CotA-like multicopper oxidase with cupredoxin domain